ncbi:MULTISPECIES: hypothetical protein [Bacillus]|uniref:hypothetical protein n=1 Tax=Bacillus TaxID=1386 RepID=UPI000B328835|nr:MULTISPECIES: hypothetical protein [Bacillus]MCX2736224.1 hypothetical protein [Bacillus sp. AnS8]UVF85967.1 hypothetical protein NWE25_09805 [Bacillus velezensis]
MFDFESMNRKMTQDRERQQAALQEAHKKRADYENEVLQTLKNIESKIDILLEKIK